MYYLSLTIFLYNHDDIYDHILLYIYHHLKKSAKHILQFLSIFRTYNFAIFMFRYIYISMYNLCIIVNNIINS